MQVLPRLFKLLPWVDLDTFYAKVKFGFCMGRSENYLFFFWNCCSLRSQSCLKHSTKWGNEVEWVSKVKVILWPWSKFTQISKLNVWLLACILRWAIQGLLAHLFRIIKMKKKIYSRIMSQWPTSCLRALFGINANISWNVEQNLVTFSQNDLQIELFQINVTFLHKLTIQNGCLCCYWK